MTQKIGKAEEIIKVAERLARTNGYNGFSFRDIAAAVGIKSASVHYHFPTKADLGAAVARRYTDRFLASLGDPDDDATPPQVLVGRYIDAFRRALVQEGQMCLCGMMGAEIDSLPKEVAGEAKRFFERNVDWLEAVLARSPDNGGESGSSPRSRALRIIASLEGALILARSLEDFDVFEKVIGSITTI